MAAYCQVYGVIHFTSPPGWLPVHQDQLRAQRSVTSMGKLYLFTTLWVKKQDTIGLLLSVTSRQTLTDFQNSFTIRLSRKFETKSYLNTPLHPKRVATHCWLFKARLKFRRLFCCQMLPCKSEQLNRQSRQYSIAVPFSICLVNTLHGYFTAVRRCYYFMLVYRGYCDVVK